MNRLIVTPDQILADVNRREAGYIRHSSHAGFNLHKKRGHQPCPACVEGERRYQAARHRRITAEAALRNATVAAA